MALFPIHKYFVHSGILKPNADFIASENEGGIYEVLRVINGIPLFLEDHLNRFFYSAKTAGIEPKHTANEIEKLLSELIRINKVSEGNVLVSFKTSFKVFFIAHYYLPAEAYKNGVDCGILHAERKNPNAKVFQTSVRQKANKLIAENNFYEVVLLDNKGFVTEGSRSNLFFIKGKQIITPTAQKVLLGITRQKTIECVKQLSLSVIEKDVPVAMLKQFDAAFITGTSPKILPIKNIGEINFNPQNEILQQLIKLLDKEIAAYIKNKS